VIAITLNEGKKNSPSFSFQLHPALRYEEWKKKTKAKRNGTKRDMARRDVVQEGGREKKARKSLVSGVVGRTFNWNTGDKGEKVG